MCVTDFMPPAAEALATGADGARSAGQGADADGPGDPVRLWADGAMGDVGAETGRWELRAVAGSDMVVLRTKAPLRGERPYDVERVYGAQGRDGGVYADVLLVAGEDAGEGAAAEAALEGDAGVLDDVDWEKHVSRASMRRRWRGR